MEIRFIKQKDANSPDLLGDIYLSDGRNTISEALTYFDSWLDALKKGALSLADQNQVSIDLIEEPDPLIFEKRDGYIVLTYGNSFIFVKNAEEILEAIRELGP